MNRVTEINLRNSRGRSMRVASRACRQRIGPRFRFRVHGIFTPTFGHAYAFDYSTLYPTNNYEYTVDLTDGEFTTVCYGDVAVLPASTGDPSIDLSLPSTVVEGQTATFGGSFTDSNQDPDGQGFYGGWIVWDGDGNTSGGNDASTLSDAVTYTEPGTYTFTAGNTFFELDGSLHAAYATAAIVVTDATPTISVTNDDSEINRADDFSLSTTFTDPMGDPVTGWQIAWGDGSTSYDPLPLYNDAAFTHAYSEAGSHEVDITATSADGTFSTSTDVTVDDPQPNVSLWSTDTDAEATESGQSPGGLYITRDDAGDTSDSLVVNYSLGGTLPSTAYIVSEQDTNQILSGNVTLPAGVMCETLLVTPLEDNTPRWTETVDATLTTGDYTIDSANSAAGVYVTDDDIEVYLANGSGNQILDGSSDGKSNLVPLVLDLPEEVRNGAVVTLTDSAPSEADVWMDSSASGTPVLGMVDGSPVSSVTWTQGVNDLAPSGLTTLWVGGTGGSATLDDIQFGISDSDSGCTVDGTNTDPVVPQDPPAQGPTANSGQSQKSTGIYVEIDSLYDPNETNPTGNIDGITRNWLIGQMADLVAVVHAPPSWTIAESFQWSLPGDVLRGINETADTRQRIPVVPKGNIWSPNRLNWSTGTQRSELVWFWVSTSNATHDTDNVSLTVSHVHGQTLTANTTFDVYSPSSSASVSPGSPIFGDLTYPPAPSFPGYSGWAIALAPGVVWTATVANVSGFASGSFRFVQEILPTGFAKNAAGQQFVPPYHGSWVLDSADPYPALRVPFNDGQGWQTGSSPGKAGDAPFLAIIDDYVQAQLNHSFKTYLMYLPTGSEGEWVPLKMEAWSFYVGIQKVNGVWTRAGNWWTSFPAFQPETAEPVWTAAVHAGPWVPVS